MKKKIISRGWKGKRRVGEKERTDHEGRAAPCSGWNLKYRASRTSTLAPETRETRRRDVEKPGNRTWTPRRHEERESTGFIASVEVPRGNRTGIFNRWKSGNSGTRSVRDRVYSCSRSHTGNNAKKKRPIEGYRRSLCQLRARRIDDNYATRTTTRVSLSMRD